MKARNILIIVCLSLFLTGCMREVDQRTGADGIIGGDESAIEARAELALINFHTFLNQEEYKKASELYRGSYEVLLGYNPTLSQNDKADLLKAACEFNGFMCLEILSAKLIEINDQGEFIYEVKFANPDGSEFILGPCCGANEEEMPSKSSFTFHVQCEDDGTCLVMDLPPYIP